MQKVRCAECGKTYDYNEDAFCPKCGTFNQPVRGQSAMRAARRDGLSEAGHKDSFLHQEYHEEEQKRRRSGLDKSADRPVRPVRSPRSRGGKPDAKRIVRWIALGYFVLMIFGNLLHACGYYFP